MSSTNSTKTFPCEQCGADLAFHIGAQKLKCNFCGWEKALGFAPEAAVEERDLLLMLNRQSEVRAQHHGSALGNQEVTCKSCGASMAFSGALTATRCSYCDAPLQRSDVHENHHGLPVDGLIPFRIEHDQANVRLQDWVQSRWFAPNTFKQGDAKGKFDGAYLPYFTFDAATQAQYQGERGEHYYVTVGSGKDQTRERRTRWHPASGTLQRFFDDVIIPAFQSLPAKLLGGVNQWPLDAVLPFTPDALAGKKAFTYERELAVCFEAFKAQVKSELHDAACRDIGGDEQQVHDLQVQYDALSYKHLLLPIWILAYRMGEQSYRVVVNGCTGEVCGERPWSAIKIALASMAACVALAVMYWVTR